MPSLQLAKNPDYTQRRFSLLGSSFLRHRPFRTGETNLGLRSVFETAIDLSFGHAQPVIVLHNFVIQLNSCTSADRPGRAQFDPLEGQSTTLRMNPAAEELHSTGSSTLAEQIRRMLSALERLLLRTWLLDFPESAPQVPVWCNGQSS